MATVSSIYKGELRTQNTHLQSSSVLITDAPTDNKGKGEAFSPTDLLATALGTCILTTIGIVANTTGFNIDGARAEITKKMAADPRRVAEVVIELTFPASNLTDKDKGVIERAAHSCPVARSLHPDMLQTVVFKYL